MKWVKASLYHLVSDCARFTIAKVIVDGKASYDLWRCGRPAELISSHSFSAEAKRAAEEVTQEAAA